MKVSNKIYDIIKYVTAVALPAVNTALLALTAIFGWPWGEQVSQVLIVVNTLLASVFCLSIAGYKASKTEEDGHIIIRGEEEKEEE